MTAVCW